MVNVTLSQRIVRMVRAVWHCVRHPFETAVHVGDSTRARAPGEADPDAEHLAKLNRSWREMLSEDPWMKRLMTHVRLLLWVVGIFSATFFTLGMVLPPKHPALSWLVSGVAATIPYWMWVGRWYARIHERVFEAFKKKFGKHHHLH